MTEAIVRQPGTSSIQTRFADLPTADVERSTFDRSHGWKSTIPKAGLCYPCFVDEMVPGDSISISATAFMRLATPLHPIMDQLHTQIHFFSVATRLVWPDFVNMMGERKTTTDKPENYTVPQISLDLTQWEDSIVDYMGLPIGQAATVSVSDLPFRCYNKIWSDWYRDQNWYDEYDPENDPQTQAQFLELKTRAKTKDYFTSALPFAQKGDQIVVPIGDKAPVLMDRTALNENGPIFDGLLGWNSPSGNEYYEQADPNTGQMSTKGGTNPYPNIVDNTLYADLQEATSISINDLRTAFQIQRLLERDARSGTRYIEHNLAHFGVTSDDRRQFRAEYLGGGSAPINITPVASTVGQVDAPQGELAAVGTGVTKCSVSHAFTEHAWVIGIMSVKSDLTYQNGIERMWSRKTRYDYYYPVFAHLGEQAILNKEIYVQGTTDDDAIWGYQERFGDMRYKPGRVCGQFRSNNAASLDTWHLAQDFQALPTLSPFFIADAPPVDRIVAVPAEPHFLADVWFSYKHTRPMPVFGVPGMVDHF